MPEIETRQLEKILTGPMGFRLTGRVRGSHFEMVNSVGVRVNPKLVKKTLCYQEVQSLKKEIEAQGGDSAQFWRLVRGQS